jgi:hypothetical protein
MILAAEQLGQQIGVAAACRTLQVVRSSLYRTRQPQAEPRPRASPSRALSATERGEVREVLNSDQFQDLAPRQPAGREVTKLRVSRTGWNAGPQRVTVP